MIRKVAKDHFGWTIRNDDLEFFRWIISGIKFIGTPKGIATTLSVGAILIILMIAYVLV